MLAKRSASDYAVIIGEKTTLKTMFHGFAERVNVHQIAAVIASIR